MTEPSSSLPPGPPPFLAGDAQGAPGAEPGLAQRLEQRLTDLEIKSTFTEDLLDELNRLVIEQQRQIDLLVREVMGLREQQSEGQPAAFRSLRDELPPHY